MIISELLNYYNWAKCPKSLEWGLGLYIMYLIKVFHSLEEKILGTSLTRWWILLYKFFCDCVLVYNISSSFFFFVPIKYDHFLFFLKESRQHIVRGLPCIDEKVTSSGSSKAAFSEMYNLASMKTNKCN